jgi:hypothetical protein
VRNDEEVDMSTLVPCSACSRHVKSDETVCPFCGAAVEAPVCSGRCGGSLPARLQHAALLAAGAALLGVAGQGCTNAVALYGAPVVDAGGQTGAP